MVYLFVVIRGFVRRRPSSSIYGRYFDRPWRQSFVSEASVACRKKIMHDGFNVSEQSLNCLDLVVSKKSK